MPALKNAKRERFAQFIASGMAVGDAYEEAGYNRDDGNATHLKQEPEVAKRIEEILGRAARRVEVSVEKVLRELAVIGFANMDDYVRIGADGDPHLDFSALTREQAAPIVELTVEDFKEGRGENARDVRRVKMKLADKRAALVDLGRTLGMFKDRVEHSGPDGGVIRTSSEMDLSKLSIQELRQLEAIRGKLASDAKPNQE